MVVRTALFVALAATLAACTKSDSEPLPDAAIKKVEERSEKDVRVDLRVVRVVDRSEEFDRLAEFIQKDEQAKSHDVAVITEKRGNGQLEVTVVQGKDRAGLAGYFGGLFERQPALALPPEHTLAFGPNERGGGAKGTPPIRAYLLENSTAIRIARLRSAEVESDAQFGVPRVKLELGEDDAVKFEAMTAASINSPIAIVKRGEVVSAPIVREPIPGGVLIVSFPVDRAETDAKEFFDDIFGDEP